MCYGSFPAIDIIAFWSEMFCQHRVWRRTHENILQAINGSMSSFDLTSTLCATGKCIDSCDIHGSHLLLYWYPYIWMSPEIGYTRLSGNQWLHTLVRFTPHWSRIMQITLNTLTLQRTKHFGFDWIHILRRLLHYLLDSLLFYIITVIQVGKWAHTIN